MGIIDANTCKQCGKWAGAHATLPGQSTDHLCMCSDSQPNELKRLRAEVEDLRDACTQKQEIVDSHRKVCEAYDLELVRLRAEVEGLRANQKCAGLEGDETGAPCNTYRMLDAKREALQQANVKLAGALDMIRETLDGAEVQDLLLIINRALQEHHDALRGEEAGK